MKTLIMLLLVALSFSSCSDSKFKQADLKASNEIKTLRRMGTVIGTGAPMDADDLDDLYLQVKVDKDTIYIPVDSATHRDARIGDEFEGYFKTN